MSAIKKIFVSSSFHESFEFGFNDERKLLKDKINGEDDLTDISLDHGHPEASQGTEEASLQRVGESQLVVFLLGRRYGTIRENGLSLTHEEYNEAVRLNKPKLCYEFPINPSDEDYEVCLEFREQIKKKDDCIVLNIEDEIKKGNFSSVFSEVVKKKSAGEKQEPNEVEKKDYALDLANKILHDIIRQFKNTRYRSFQYVPPIPEDYFPRDTHIEAIKEKLEKNKGVVVSGMSGIGKTTLSIILGNDNNLKNDFKDGIYYLKMGQDPNLEDKQNDLLSYLENSNSKGTLGEIIKQDFADRKALLILDDVWVFEHFLPFDITNQETRSKIIITTRQGQKFRFSEYLIEQLNEDESLAMLKQKIGWSTTDSELETICKRMSKKCGGLPLAISAVARVLATDKNLKRCQDVENDFETILEKIPADEENRTVYASFQLSVRYLDEETKNRYFSLSILFNKHSSFFESETLRVYWGSNPWYILESLKEASLLTEQISHKGIKQYALHDLQKTFIKEKTKEQDLINYKKQFIQNYQEKYAPDWHKIPFYEQNNFYRNYLEICQDLNEQNLAKEISENILYKNSNIYKSIVKKIIEFLKLTPKEAAPRILKVNKNGYTVVWLFTYLEPTKKTEYANKYLKKAIKQNFEGVSKAITAACFKEADEELRKDFANGYLEKAIKQDFEGVNKAITAECFKEADEELRKDFANGYLEKAIKQDFEAVKSRITAECFKEADEELRKDFANGYLEKAIKQDFKGVNSDIIVQCFKEVDKELRKDIANGYLEKAIKQNFEGVSKAITAACFKEADEELRKDFANGYLEKAIKQGFEAVNKAIIAECFKEADKELRKDFANGYLEKAIKQDFEGVNIKIITQCFKEVDKELRKDIANGYLEKTIKQDFEAVNSDIIIQCFKEVDKELRKDFANGYLEKAIKQDFEAVNSEIIKQYFKEVDKELRKDIANGYLEKAIKHDFESVNSDIIVQCFKEVDKELRKDIANGYLEKAIKQNFEGVSKAITAACFKEADEELRKDFANGYLEKAIKQDFKGVKSRITAECFKEADEELRKDFANGYLEKAIKQDFKGVKSRITAECFKEADEELRKDFANGYLEKAIKQDFKGVNSDIIIQCFKEAGEELRKDFANGYLEKAIKQDFESVNSEIIAACFKEADKELRKDFANGYLEKAIKQNFEGVSKAITAACFKEADEELRKDFANGYLEKAIKQDFEGVNIKIITQCFKEVDKELRKDIANGYLEKTIKQDFEAVNSDIIIQCFKEVDKELRKDFANGYLEKAIKQDFKGVNSDIIIQCFKEAGEELRKDFANGYLEKAIKQDFESINSEIIAACFKEADKELRKDFANGYLEKAIKQNFEGVSKAITAACFKEADKELRKDFANGYLEKAIKQNFEGVSKAITAACFKEADEELRKDFANGYLEKAIKQNFEGVSKAITAACFKEADEGILQDFANRYFLLNFNEINQHISRICFRFVKKNHPEAIEYAENFIKQKHYKNINALNSCLRYLSKSHQTRKDFAEKELKKIAQDEYYLGNADEMLTKTLLIQTEINNYNLLKEIATNQLYFEFTCKHNRYRFPFYSKYFTENRLLINVCLKFLVEIRLYKSVKGYANTILSCWEDEIGYRDELGKYHHDHIITALNIIMEKDAIKIVMQILEKDNELCQATEDKKNFFLSEELDHAINRLLKKYISSLKGKDKKKKKIFDVLKKYIFPFKTTNNKVDPVLLLLQETANIRKKLHIKSEYRAITYAETLNTLYRAIAYAETLNTLSYFYKIHSPKNKAINYKKEAINLIEKACQDRKNYYWEKNLAQYKAELQELTN